MKKYILILILFVSCNIFAQTKTIFEGKIINHKDKIIILTLEENYNLEKLTFKEKLNKKGEFRFEIEINKTYYGKFHNSGEESSICISPRDEIYMTLNTNEFDETIHYKGIGANKNNFLASKFLKFEDNGKQIEVYKKISQLDAEEFKIYCDSIIFAFDNFIANFNKSKKLPTDFVQVQKTWYYYYFASFQINYAGLKKYYAQLNEMPEIDEHLFTIIDTISLNNEKYLVSPYYQDFVKQFIYNKAIEIIERTKIENNYTNISYQLAKLYLTGQVKEYIIYLILNDAIKYYSENDFKNSYKDYLISFTDTILKNKIIKSYNKNKFLFAGSPAPSIELEDNNGNTVKLSDFKGKVVYIDFWASWCSPCIQEISHSKELQKEFINEEIIFLYISIDKDRASWLNAIEKYQINGIHLFDGNDFVGKIATKYNITGVPKYFIIDKQGKIFKRNAPRPSQKEEISKLLNKALNN